MEDVVKHKDGTTTKQFNFCDTSEGRSHYLEGLEERGVLLNQEVKDKPLVSARDLSQLSGRAIDLSVVHRQAAAELAANRGKKQPISEETVCNTVNKMTFAKRIGESSLQETEEDKFQKRINDITKSDRMQLLLRHNYMDFTKTQLNKKTKEELTPYMVDLLTNIDPHAADKTADGRYIQLP